MAHTTLTKEQAEIIAKIENEFLNLNKLDEDKPFAIIDINALNKMFDSFSKRKVEYEIEQRAIHALRKETINSVVDKLQKDFKNGNLPFIVKHSMAANSFTITSEELSHDDNYYYHIDVNVSNDWHSGEFGTTYTRDLIIKLKNNGGSSFNPSDVRYSSFEQAFASDQMKKMLTKIYDKVMEGRKSKIR